MEFTFGCDPEVMLVDRESQTPVSAIGLIGGNKDHPRPTEHGSIQEDGVLAEFNIPPVSTEEDAVNAINRVMDDLREVIPGSLEIKVLASNFYPIHQLQHPLAQLSGCDPDFNIWIEDVNIKPDLSSTPLRSCGGHIHVGGSVNPSQLIKCLDLYLGVPSILMDPDVTRKELFGKAGAHRLKSYGVEYRTLSNFWIGSDELIRWAFRNTKKAYNTHKDMDIPQIVEECINTFDRDMAQDLVERYNLEVI